MKSTAEDLPLDGLASFVAVADAGSFTIAATRAAVPRSSLSRHIAALEQALGERLIHRTTRRMSLSPAGLELLERIRPALVSLQDGLADFAERGRGASGEVRVTAPNDFANHVLGPLLPQLHRRHPELRLDLHLTNRLVDLAAEGVDLAIRVVPGAAADSGLVIRRLAPIEMGIYAAPEYLARHPHPRQLEDLREHDWIWFVGSRARREPPLGRVVATVDDFQFVHKAVRAAAGLGRMPTFLADTDLAAGHLVRVLPRESWAVGHFCLVYAKTRRPSRRMVAVRDFLLETLGR
ncbi:MAG TPA: LysR substrate-binding domain-containing protein [Polyangia bacterium]|nr:LysR substrate-binding domain-containing protein [Polyangia bacterium]